MEWLRACYKSKWRLIRGSDFLRDGFYYFADASTPFYPGTHQLWSRVWVSDERGPDSGIGEYAGPQTWWKGEPPARRPLAVRVGSEDCIAHGEPAPLTVISGKSAFCEEILPAPCYGREDSIFALTNVLDCVFAKKTADIIDKAYSDLAAAAAIVAGYMPAGTVVTTFPQPNAFVPAGIIASIGDTVVLWLTGTTNFQQLAAQAFYFGFGPIDQGRYSTSGIDETAALFVADQLNAAGLGAAGRIVLTGHSFGGAVAMVLAAKMLAADSNRLVELLTLGAPSPGDQRLIDLIAPLFQVHYANEQDPIPYLPPRGLTFAGLLPVIGPVLALFWPTFARVPVQRTITEDGKFVDQRTEDLPNDAIAVCVAAIAAGLDVPSFKPHRTDWYAYKICLACPCVPRPCTPPVDELNFNVGMRNYSYRFDGVVHANSIGIGGGGLPSRATIIARFPNGMAKTWRYFGSAGDSILIEAGTLSGTSYTTFRYSYHPNPEDPLWLTYWDFTYAQLVTASGRFVNPAPTHFEKKLPIDAWFFLFELFAVPIIL